MMNFYWIEVKRFLNKYSKTLFLSPLVFGLLFTGIMLFRNNERPPAEDPKIEENTEIFEGDSLPAYFKFYIKEPDGYAYTNGATVRELFNFQNVIDLASENIGVDLEELTQDVRQSTSKENFTPVNVEINTTSHIFTASFTTGDNKNNINLAEFYYNYLFNEGFEILDNNMIYNLEEPQFIDRNPISETSNSSETPVSENFVLNIIIDAFIGTLLGLALAVIFTITKECFSKILNFSFSYNTGDPKRFMLYDESITEKNLLENFIGLPIDYSKAIISHLDIINHPQLLLNNDNKIDLKHYSSLSSLPLDVNIDEIIIVVFTNVTDRKWYNEQLEYSKMHNVPVKIIQINEDKKVKSTNDLYFENGDI